MNEHLTIFVSFFLVDSQAYFELLVQILFKLLELGVGSFEIEILLELCRLLRLLILNKDEKI